MDFAATTFFTIAFAGGLLVLENIIRPVTMQSVLQHWFIYICNLQFLSNAIYLNYGQSLPEKVTDFGYPQ